MFSAWQPSKLAESGFRLLLISLVGHQAVSFGGVTGVSPYFGPSPENSPQLQRITKFRINYRRNSVTSGKIVFGNIWVWNPTNAWTVHDVRHQIQANFYGYRREYTNEYCFTRWPLPVTGVWFDEPAFAVATADYTYPQNPHVGLRSFDPVAFPRTTSRVDGGSVFLMTGSYQGNPSQQDITVCFSRGGTFTNDWENWARDCICPLDTNLVYRRWDIQATIGSRTFSFEVAIPSDEGVYLFPGQMFNLRTEFFEFPGLLQAYFWDAAYQREEILEWVPVRQWLVNERLEGPDVPETGWGARIASFRGMSVLELSNDRSDTYARQVGTILDLPSSPGTATNAVPVIEWVSAAQTASETNGTIALSARLVNGRVASANITVGLVVAGTAHNPEDHDLPPGLDLVILPGQSQAEITFHITNDANQWLPDKTVVVQMDTATNAMIGGTSVHTVTIRDGDWLAYDDVPPSPPDLTWVPGITCTLMGVAWKPAKDRGGSGVKLYRIFRDGIFVKEVAAPETSTTDPVPSGAHTYQMTAVDGNGNESALSSPYASGTPSCPPDVAAPLVTLFAPTAGAGVWRRLHLSAGAVDDVGVTRIDFFRDADVNLGRPVLRAAGISGTNAFYILGDIDADISAVPAGAHEFYARAYDDAGHVTQSQPVLLLVDNEDGGRLALNRNTGERALELRWPTNWLTQTLETTTNLSLPATWHIVTNEMPTVGSNRSLTVVATNPSTWFRLSTRQAPGGVSSSFPPYICLDPTNQLVSVGERAVFTVCGSGSEPLSLRWSHEGIPLLSDGRIRGAETSLLTIGNVAPSDAGAYSVVLSNVFGQVTSGNGILRLR